MRRVGRDSVNDVGAVIVTHSQFRLARRAALAMVEALGDPGRVVVVVNRAEGVEHVDVGGVTVLVNEHPVGYGANLNRGVAALPADVSAVLLLNDDVLVDRSSIERLVARFADAGVGLAGPAMVGRDGRSQAAAFRFPTVVSEAVDSLLFPPGLAGRARRRWGRSRAPVEWVQGAAMLARRSAFDAVGGFDEGYHLYFEELDLATRLAAAGWITVHEADAVAVHEAHATLGLQHLDSYGASRARYFEQHWSRRRRWLLRVALGIVHGIDRVIVALATIVGADRQGAKRAALRVQLARRPRWAVVTPGAERA